AENFATVKLFVNGGGALPQKIREQFEKLSGAKILEGYGLSEASPVVSINDPKNSKEGSIGKPVPRTKVKITDIETGLDVLAVGMTGEITVRGPQVMAGYYNKPEATAKKLRGGWLYTGDIGYMDAEGNLYLTDRRDDMAKISGENVYPSEVEKVILRHPDIAETVV
ncbi:MAG: AMP-binding protein, partial [Patescibacteria group bacterium]